jgi:hypothetical protein
LHLAIDLAGELGILAREIAVGDRQRLPVELELVGSEEGADFLKLAPPGGIAPVGSGWFRRYLGEGKGLGPGAIAQAKPAEQAAAIAAE